MLFGQDNIVLNLKNFLIEIRKYYVNTIDTCLILTIIYQNSNYNNVLLNTELTI